MEEPSPVREPAVVDGDFGIYHVHLVREMLERGSIVLAPGGHSFERIDTTCARDVRKDLYAFLEKHLK